MGEEKSEKFGIPLEYSLQEWMHGRGIKKNVQSWFNFSVPKPSVPPNFVSEYIHKYEKERNIAFSKKLPADESKIFWLGGEKLKVKEKTSSGCEEFYQWTYMGETFKEKISAPPQNYRGKGLCVL